MRSDLPIHEEPDEIERALRDVAVPATVLFNIHRAIELEAFQQGSVASVPANPAYPVKPRYARRVSRIAAVVLALASCILLVAYLSPRLVSRETPDQIHLIVNQRLDELDLDSMRWRTVQKVPKRFAKLVDQLQDLSVQQISTLPTIPPWQGGEVLGLRTSAGKIVLLLELRSKRVEGVSERFQPVSSGSGGWSCAIASESGSVFVLAVAGGEHELMRLLRSPQLT